MTVVRDRRRRPRRLRRVRDLAARRDARTRSRCSTRTDPLAAWRPRPQAIRQRRCARRATATAIRARSPASPREALRTRSPGHFSRPCNCYRPTVAEFLRHVEELRERCGWDESFCRHRVARVTATDGGFGVDEPARFATCSSRPAIRGSACRASSPTTRGPSTRTSRTTTPRRRRRKGMAAATEWLNALSAGAEVVSVRRREPARRPLNVPRPLFSKAGLASFHASERRERTRLLTRFGELSHPPGREWDEPIECAEREGRFRVAESVDGEARSSARRVSTRFRARPAVARGMHDHGLDTERRWIVLAADGTVPALTDGQRTLALAGAPAQGVSRRGHARRDEVRRAPVPTRSYTLRGRVESRLAAVILPFVVACIGTRAPCLVAGRACRMLGAALALDVLVYHRFLPYQPGWAALLLGCSSSGRRWASSSSSTSTPAWPAIFFVGSWILARPRARGASARAAHVRRGRRRAAAGRSPAVLAPCACSSSSAPRRHPAPDGLSRGRDAGPLVLDHSQTLVGRPGVVRGGIVITSDDVVVRDLAIEGGEYGIAIEGRRTSSSTVSRSPARRWTGSTRAAAL